MCTAEVRFCSAVKGLAGDGGGVALLPLSRSLQSGHRVSDTLIDCVVSGVCATEEGSLGIVERTTHDGLGLASPVSVNLVVKGAVGGWVGACVGGSVRCFWRTCTLPIHRRISVLWLM